MNYYLLAAAGISGLTTLVHLFAGGPSIARPLLNAPMDDVARYTNYYCWHMVSIMLVAMTAGYWIAALYPAQMALAIMMTVLAGAFTVWNVILIGWKRQSWLQMPQWMLFLPIAILGVIGLAGTNT